MNIETQPQHTGDFAIALESLFTDYERKTQKRLTRAEFSRMTKISHTQLYRLLNGSSSTRRTTIARIIDAFAITDKATILSLYRSANVTPIDEKPCINTEPLRLAIWRRRRQGIRQNDLAKELHISINHLSRILNNTGCYDIERVKRLCQLLDVSQDDVITKICL